MELIKGGLDIETTLVKFNPRMRNHINDYLIEYLETKVYPVSERIYDELVKRVGDMDNKEVAEKVAEQFPEGQQKEVENHLIGYSPK